MKKPRTYQLGLYDPLNDELPPRLLGFIYVDTPEDRELMRETIAEFNDLAAVTPASKLCLSAFPARKRKASKR